MIGRSVSHFKIQDKLGQGGMGVVYKALDTNLDRTVALKFLPAQFSADEKSKARFIQEAKAASALDHANICAIYEIGETDDGELFIAMAYYDGQTLKYRMGEEQFSAEQATNVGRQLAAALDRAHESGIVHRDIKPANIMLTERGDVKLLDFGLAKLAGGAELTVEGSTLGTAAYMSPEQARGSDITAASDIWAVGTVMYEMLAGAKPFGGEYESALIYGILNEDPEPLAERRADIPEELADLVMRCLSKDATKRPSAQKLIQELGGASGTRPVSQAASHSPLNKPVLIGGAILLILIASLATWGIMSGTGDSNTAALAGSDSDHSVAVLPFELFSATDQETSLMFAGGMHNDVLTRLSTISGLRVIARTSVSQYQGTTKSASLIASELGVSSVLEGTIQRAGDRVRVSVQLIDAKTESPLWGETYDEELTTENIFSIQSDLARSIATALETTLSPAEVQILEARPDVSVEAYDLFTTARYRSTQVSRNNPQAMNDVADQLEKALLLEPDYAEAQATLANVYLRGISASIWSPEEKMDRAKELVSRALDLNPDLPIARQAEGMLHYSELRWEESEQALLRAIELAPGDVDGLIAISGLYINVNRMDDAIESVKKALDLDPLNMSARLSLSDVYLFGGQYQAGVDESERTIRMDPLQEHAHYVRGFGLAMLGRPQEAIPALEEAIRLSPNDLFSKMGLAFAYALAGREQEAERQMDLVPDSPAMMKEKSIVHGVLGDLDTAFALLDEAFNENPAAVSPIVGDPTVAEQMTADPRWAALLEKLGL